MALDTTTWDWEPLDALQVYAAGETWITEFALALHADAYYLQVRTYQAAGPAPARVRIGGPYPDVMRALAAVRRLIHGAQDALVGTGEGNETRAALYTADGR
jgi:hypothetical protein